MRRRFTACLFSFALLALLTSPASAQVPAARIKALQTRFNQLLKAYNKIPSKYQKTLDGNANAVQLARIFPQIAPNLTKPHISRAVLKADLLAATGLAGVNSNKTDLDLSSFAGYTQSETSTARCGSQVVVGFNDSGSYLQTLVNGTGGVSFSGAAVSSNGGASFKDVGPMNPGTNVNNFIVGDPVVNCTDSSTFYYSQIFYTADSTGYPIASIALSKSTDGGNTWGEPGITVSKDGYYHSLDKSWSTIDPSNPQRIYVSYTDFDYTGTSATCPNDFRYGVEVVASNDGGQTFGDPIIIAEECGASNNGLQDSHVAVSSNGTVNVAWEWFNNFPVGTHELRFTSFAPGGSPGAAVVVDTILPGGDSYYLQGSFRDFIDLDMTVDRSGTDSDGVLYVTWADGRDKIIPDVFAFNGQYAFDDVLFRSSYDGGQTWGYYPTKVNSDIQPRHGFGHDHYQPGIAVDPTGKVAVCWYDRRNDANNFKIQRYCGESSNGGYTWSNFQVPAGAWGPSHGNDQLVNSIYEGDYDGLTSDTLKTTNGFIGAFGLITDGANPDVKAYAFQ
jgi:hypothetical protein